MRILYLDCGMGAAGDMLSAALLELLPDPDSFVAEINVLGLPGVHVARERAVKCGITGTHLSVTVHGRQEHSHDHHDHDHHHDHGHHHADDVFTSWGAETAHKYERAELEALLEDLADTTLYGTVLRAKGMLPSPDGSWLYFDLTPGEYEIREGSPEYTGRLCVIGSDLKEDDLKQAFHIA